MMQYPDLSEVLAGIPWAVIGGVATRLYMPERATLDLDVAVAASEGARVRNRLREAGYRYTGELSVGGSSWSSPAGASVDVLELDAPWALEALQEAQGNRDLSTGSRQRLQGMPVLPLPHLVLMKLQAGRVQDLADAARMLGQAPEEALARVRRLFQRYAPHDLEDVESLITLGKLELG